MLALDTHLLGCQYLREGRASRAQAEAARAVIDGGARLFVPTAFVPELEWVLRGVYEHPPVDVARVLDHLLSLGHVENEDRAAVESALGNVKRGLDFADALHHASSRACEAFLTLDAKGFTAKARRMAITAPVRLAS
jgi:predicted nucleic-acid-binding protein